MNEMEGAQTTHELLERVKKLPPLPAAVVKAQLVLNEADVDYHKLEKVIGADAALAGMVLKIANSSFYGLNSSVESIREACMVLGLHVLRNLIVAAGVVAQFSAEGAGQMDREALWAHLRATAICAQMLAKKRRLPAEKAFVAGLFHDLGKLALEYCFAEEMKKVLAARDAKNISMRQAEYEVLGVGHAEIGAALAKRWNFPDEIVECIAYHHTDERIEKGGLVAVIHVADVFSRMLNLGNGGDELVPEANKKALASIGWDELNKEEMAAEIRDSCDEFARLFSA